MGLSFLLPAAGLTSSVLLVAFLLYSRKPLLLGLCFLLFFSGMARAQAAVNPVLPPEGKYHISAAVAGLAERREDDGRVKALLRDVEIEDEQAKRYHIKSAYWTYYPSMDAPLPLDGQRINMTASVYHPLGRQNPQGFNFRLYLLQRGITLGVSGAKDLLITPVDQKIASDPWLRARIWLGDLYDKAIGEGSELIRALLWGDRGGLGDEVEGSFRATGITHVLSVSGLHVSILAGALLYLLAAAGMPPRRRFIVVVAALALYCRLLNFEAPVLRSAVMSAVLLGARLYDERSDPLTSLSVAMMVILAWRPLDLFHVGFQLSFLAVLGMFTLGDRLNDMYGKVMRHRKRNRHADKSVAALQATVSATAFTAPVMINTFHGFSLIGILFSPIACLIIGILMLYGMAIMPVALLWMPLAQFLAMPLSWGSQLFIQLTDAVASLPFPSVRSASLGGVGLVFCYAALLLCTRYVRVKKRLLRLTAIALTVAVMTGLSLYSQQMDKRDVRYTLFSSGNADAAVIEDGRQTFVIDAAEQGGDLCSY
ncbi:MAG: ComEC family competence protein, partial [Clostridiales bacterium]|nr:ComEC family competence protein [Clostridiales bacterium]